MKESEFLEKYFQKVSSRIPFLYRHLVLNRLYPVLNLCLLLRLGSRGFDHPCLNRDQLHKLHTPHE
jgi:hypothetical protein